MATSIKAQYSPRPRGILENKLCQEAPVENEFYLIEAKCWGMNKQVNIRIYIGNLDKDEIKVLTMHKIFFFVAKLCYHSFEGQEIILR